MVVGRFVAEAIFDLAYLAPAALRQAEIHERSGEREAAAEHYRRLLSLWRDCDPRLRPPVEYAEERLAELTGGGARG